MQKHDTRRGSDTFFNRLLAAGEYFIEFTEG